MGDWCACGTAYVPVCVCVDVCMCYFAIKTFQNKPLNVLQYHDFNFVLEHRLEYETQRNSDSFWRDTGTVLIDEFRCGSINNLNDCSYATVPQCIDGNLADVRCKGKNLKSHFIYVNARICRPFLTRLPVFAVF